MRPVRGQSRKSAEVPRPAAGTGNARVTVNSRAVARLRAGHPWIYRSDVISAGPATAGAVVDLADERERTLGSALYSSSSVIALRVIAPEPLPEDEVAA